MKPKIKWALALISVGIFFTTGGALMKILHYAESNRLLILGLISNLTGIGFVVSDLLYTKKYH